MNFSILDMEFLIAKAILKQILSLLSLLGSTTTEIVQHDPQDSSLFERDFILFFNNFISNKASPLINS